MERIKEDTTLELKTERLDFKIKQIVRKQNF